MSLEAAMTRVHQIQFSLKNNMIMYIFFVLHKHIRIFLSHYNNRVWSFSERMKIYSEFPLFNIFGSDDELLKFLQLIQLLVDDVVLDFWSFKLWLFSTFYWTVFTSYYVYYWLNVYRLHPILMNNSHEHCEKQHENPKL